jgi:hypothetical protein
LKWRNAKLTKIGPIFTNKLLSLGAILQLRQHIRVLKGQLISKWLFDVFDFLQKTNENRFLEEIEWFSFVL